MRLKYDSKKPRRVEILVFADDVIDVPKRIGETLERVTGFKKTTSKVTEPDPTPFDHLAAVTDALTAEEVDEDLVNAVLALAATVEPGSEDEVPEGTVEELVGWVDGDPAKAQAVLDVEHASETPRSTLVEQLEAIVQAEPVE